MKDEHLGFLVNEEPWGWGVDFAFVTRMGQTVSYALPLTMQEVKEGGFIRPFTNVLKPDVQRLFDRLWELGYRPVNNEGSSGHLKAIEKHLQDMRTLVFKQLTPAPGEKE